MGDAKTFTLYFSRATSFGCVALPVVSDSNAVALKFVPGGEGVNQHGTHGIHCAREHFGWLHT